MKSIGHAALHISCYVYGTHLVSSNVFTSENNQLAGLSVRPYKGADTQVSQLVAFHTE